MNAPTLTPAQPAAAAPAPTVQVRVWFGQHKLMNWEGPAAEAPSIAAGYKRRFPGLRVDNAAGVDW